MVTKTGLMAEELKKGWWSTKGGAVHKLVMQKSDGSDRLKNWLKWGQYGSDRVEWRLSRKMRPIFWIGFFDKVISNFFRPIENIQFNTLDEMINF